ncbi:MAG: sel1 repeat family protein [Proteobacteria bacterium]|nr:sel1 repeat family protein [Pseudomonadota bacterium]
MTTPKAKLGGLALIAVLCAGFTLGLTAPARAGVAEGSVAYLVGDYATAIREFRPLAEQGMSAAQYFLGLMYYKGQGVPQDFAEAVKWYRKAAEQGYTLAQYNLGRMYSRGQGVIQDYVQAHMWVNLAVSKLPPGESRDKAVGVRDFVAKRMTPAQISEAQKLARKWRPKYGRVAGRPAASRL